MKISKEKRIMLEGIKVLSKQLNRDLERLVIAVADITEEELEDNYAHASDFIYDSNETVASYLRKVKK